MANLLAIAELEWRNIFPEPREKTSVTKEEFIATAKTEYAAAMWIFRQEEIALNGIFDMPTDLLTTKEMEVVNNEIDLSQEENILRGLSGDIWLQDVGGQPCECKYLKTTINLQKLLCDDDSLDDNVKPYRVEGKKIKFLKGTHKPKISITFANMGSDINEDTIEVNDYVASRVREKLRKLYGQPYPMDSTNNQNPNS